MTVMNVIGLCAIFLSGLGFGYRWGREDGKRLSAGKPKLRLFGEDLDD